MRLWKRKRKFPVIVSLPRYSYCPFCGAFFIVFFPHTHTYTQIPAMYIHAYKYVCTYIHICFYMMGSHYTYNFICNSLNLTLHLSISLTTLNVILTASKCLLYVCKYQTLFSYSSILDSKMVNFQFSTHILVR